MIECDILLCDYWLVWKDPILYQRRALGQIKTSQNYGHVKKCLLHVGPRKMLHIHKLKKHTIKTFGNLSTLNN
jgi:hypothetical protein